jgi:Septum formation
MRMMEAGMTAPAGVNEGSPHEPAEVGTTPAEDAVTRTGDGEVLTEAATESRVAEPGMVPATAVTADDGAAEAELAGTELAEGDTPGQARTGRDVSPLAVAGIIIGVIALVGVAAGALAIITHGFRPKTVVTYRPAAVFNLQPGQCVNAGTTGLADTVVSCGTAHDAEVFASFQLTGSWPGTAGVKQEASNGCASRFSSYLNPQLATAALNQQFVYPNQQAWQAGERTVVCEVSSSDGKLTGSVRKGA